MLSVKCDIYCTNVHKCFSEFENWVGKEKKLQLLLIHIYHIISAVIYVIYMTTALPFSNLTEYVEIPVKTSPLLSERCVIFFVKNYASYIYITQT